MKICGVLLLVSILLLPLVTRAEDGNAPPWKPVASELLKREKTGFGGLCGLVVDHTSGEVWVNLSDRGMFHSDDQGESWKRVSDMQPSGRTETPGCWLLDPTGNTKRMVTALVYGDAISISQDQAVTWKPLAEISRHIDWCAVDWTDMDFRFVLALKHEAGGMLLASNNGGESFVEVGKGYGTGWVFDNQTAVVAQTKSNEHPQPHLMRTTDGGKTFQSCGEFSPVGTNSAQALPKWNSGTLYWLVEGGLIATTDKGASWKKVGEIKEAQYGPIFGRDAQQLFVLTKSGPVESTDGGITWSEPLTPPQAMQGIGGLSWLEYDPQHDALYLMKMGSDLYRLSRGK
jgi:photosystem II stability/assembly factor-like uncharacterized protein